jgi:hypothetical protein
VERKTGRIRRVKHWQIALAIFVALSASIALADDFKTVNGKEYKDATVSRVEPDGIVIKFRGGIVKLQFTELPADVQKKYGYDPVAAREYAAQRDRVIVQPTPTPDANLRTSEDTYRLGYNYGYYWGHDLGKYRFFGGEGDLPAPTGDELNYKARESARQQNVPSDFWESYRQGYRLGFEQGYKDAARPAF